jgi:hypothetical protein
MKAEGGRQKAKGKRQKAKGETNPARRVLVSIRLAGNGSEAYFCVAAGAGLAGGRQRFSSGH